MNNYIYLISYLSGFIIAVLVLNNFYKRIFKERFFHFRYYYICNGVGLISLYIYKVTSNIMYNCRKDIVRSTFVKINLNNKNHAYHLCAGCAKKRSYGLVKTPIFETKFKQVHMISVLDKKFLLQSYRTENKEKQPLHNIITCG